MLAYDFEIFLRFYIILSPNPLLMNTANVKDSENADRWLTVLSSGFGERVDTFFRQGCGTTLGVQPWTIAREL